MGIGRSDSAITAGMRRLLVAGVAVALGVTVLAVPPAVAGPGAVSVASADARATESTSASIRLSRQRVGPGDGLTITSTLADTATGDTVTGASLLLQWQRLGAPGWLPGEVASTGARGSARWQVDPIPESRRYRVVFEGSPGLEPVVSAVAKVRLKPVLTVSASRDWVRPGATATVKARVRPAYQGEMLTLQNRVSGVWRDVRSKRQDAGGGATFSVRGRATYGPQRYRVVLGERKHHLGVRSRTVRIDTVRLVTYEIETRGKVKGALPSFRRRSAEIYADPRGWSRADVHFKRVSSGGMFSLVLSQAKYVPTFAPICDRYWSCRVGRYVIINENRWRQGTPYFKSAGGTLRQYRAMVVNHETGHWFGLGHATCGGKGQPAPVMMQQSKGLYGCSPNAWPLAWEISRAR